MQKSHTVWTQLDKNLSSKITNLSFVYPTPLLNCAAIDIPGRSPKQAWKCKAQWRLSSCEAWKSSLKVNGLREKANFKVFATDCLTNRDRRANTHHYIDSWSYDFQLYIYNYMSKQKRLKSGFFKYFNKSYKKIFYVQRFIDTTGRCKTQVVITWSPIIRQAQQCIPQHIITSLHVKYTLQVQLSTTIT